MLGSGHYPSRRCDCSGSTRAATRGKGNDGDSQVGGPGGGIPERGGNDPHRRLARAIADAGMSGFLSKLEYKCLWYGAEYAKADRWFASSKLCAHCGWKNADLTLSDREWWCGGCGVLVERDANAALNLERWPGSSFPVFRLWRMEPCKFRLRQTVACEASTSTASTCESPIARLGQV